MIRTVSEVDVLIPCVVDCLELVGQNHSGFYACLRCPVVESLDNGEDKSADIGKQAPVVAEIRSQNTRYRENELPMGQTQQQMIPHVL